MFKKITAALVLVSMISSLTVSTYASNDYWDYDDFSDALIGSEWTLDGGSGNVSKLNKENQNYELNKYSDSEKAGLYYNIPSTINSGKIAIEFSFYMNGTDDKAVQIKGANSKGQDIYLYRFIQNRKASVRNEDSGYTDLSDDILTKGKKYTFKTEIDFDADGQNITTYINSVEASAKKGFQKAATVADLKKISFYLPAASEYKGGGIVIDDFKIYYRGSDGESVIESYTGLDLGDTSAVCENLTLPTSDENGVTIKWTSQRPEVISNTGIITRSYFKNEEVVLTAKVSKNDAVMEKAFNVTVLKSDENPTDEELVAKTKASLDLGDISAVTNNLTLPEYNSLYDTVIRWESESKDIISDKGVVTRPLKDSKVTLIATIIRGDARDTKKFDVCVIRYMPEYSEPTAVLAESSFLVEKAAGQESTSMSIAKNLSGKAKNIVTISFDYTLSGTSGQYVDFNILGSKNDDAAFDAKIRFTGGSYLQLRNPDPKTGKVSYVSLSDKAGNDEKHNIKMVFNTLFPELEVWVDEEKCDVGTYIPYDLKAVNSVNWSIPGGVGGLKMLVENVNIDTKIKYKDIIKKDIEVLNIGDLDGLKADLDLPTTGEYGSGILWKSSDDELLRVEKNKAIIKRPAALTEKATVTLTAKVSAGDFGDDKTFECTLYGLSEDDLGTTDGKTDELLLMKKWEYDDSDIVWSSKDVSVIEREDGYFISGMLIEEVSKEIELTATVIKNSKELGSKNFKVVLENPSYYDLTKGNSIHPEIVPAVTVSSGSVFEDTGVWVADVNDTKPYYQVDFGCELTVNCAEIEVYGQAADYVLEGSLNGTNWTSLDINNSSTDGKVAFDRVNARYIRYSVRDKAPGETGLVSFRVFYRYSDELYAQDNLKDISLPATVDDDLMLPVVGDMGLAVVWSSSAPDVITDNGIVTREEKDVVVNMKATTEKNGKSFERIFPVTVTGTGKTSPSGSRPSGGGGGGGGVVSAPMPSVAEKEVPETVLGFSDLPDSHWAKEAIYNLYSRGIINGTGKNTFEPDRAVTRAEFVQLITGAFDIPKSEGKEFNDVLKNSWYYEAVMAASGAKIVSGTGEKTFEPDAPIKRQDMAVVLKNLLDYKGIEVEMLKEADFYDSHEISDYAKESVALLTGGNIISGNSDNMFNPKANATRAEAARLIYVILNLDR